MNHFKAIQNKLEAFIRRYYTNELIKGTILFFAIGLIYFLITLFIEYVLWLNPTARTILFWLFILVEVALLARFMAVPLAKLFKLQKGINYETASKIIGKHFPEVNDKLLNVLQLQQDTSKSELLLASIEQKSEELNPVPFKLAINFKKNMSYLKYAAIPILILLVTFITGKSNWFSDSYQRVVNYKTAYEPPAPFQFFVINNDLNAIENKDFKLFIKTVGEVTPESVEIVFNDESYFLQDKGAGAFEYVFSRPNEVINFSLKANDINSKPYILQIIETPSLVSLKMQLDYPPHTKKKNEILKSTGNAVVPEGTEVTWNLGTKSTDNVRLYAKDTLEFSLETNGIFKSSKQVLSDLDYQLSTSNSNLVDYENLSFSIDVIKDEFPELKLKMERDSLDLQTLYFYGQVSDDYGFRKLQLVYYPSDNERNKNYKVLPISETNISEFITAFPNNLDITDGVPYSLYFQVFDNDRVNKYKSAKSSVFTYRKRTKEEEEQKILQEQNETIQDLNKSLKKFDKQNKDLQEISKTQKEKSSLNFNDKKKLELFIKRQKQQDEMMQNFNKQLKDNVENFQKESKEEDEFKEDLKKRLEQNEEQLKKDEKLLKELEKIQEKINKEELSQKLEELAKQNKNKKRSLQQLLELAKRFYVEKKLEKLQNELEQLAKQQDKLSEEAEDKNTQEKQEELNKEFEEYQEKLEELQKDNKELKKPMEIPRDKLDEQEVKEEQQKASDELDQKEQNEDAERKKENQKNAQKSQKKAAQKMKEMSAEMSQSMQSSGGEQMEEDTEMLRQVLDNLVLFSLNQEALMDQFKNLESNHNRYANYLRKQSNLKEYFEHIDDSLFALSLRQPKLSETVNKEISEVFFNIDKSLEQFAENQIYQGVSNQQFVISAANNLADFLSNILDNMQEKMSMSRGQGKGDMQLPDIIMTQEQLQKMMEDGMKKGEDGKPKDEGKGKEEGDKGQQGKDGKEGENGNSGTQGKSGEQKGEGGFTNDKNGGLYEIYRQQQMLREALQNSLEKEGMGDNGKNVLKRMEEIEMDLLNKGFTNKTLQKMMELQHQLLKLENAVFQQGEDNKRKSESNETQFENETDDMIPIAKQYFQSTEILNRQALPLRQIYKKKVQAYFKK